MPTTYEPIQTYTLGSAAPSITFSSIPATYTDLRLVLVGSATGSASARIQFNSDTGSNYSQTVLYGTGAGVGSYRNTSFTYVDLTATNNMNTPIVMKTIDLFSYAGSTFKTILTDESNDLNGSGSVTKCVGLWRSTAAITSILFYLSANNFAIGTTATLYGIKNF